MCSWFEYLNFLPNEVSGMPMYWTKKELQPLRNTSLADKLDGKWGMPGCHVEPPTQVSCATAPEGMTHCHLLADSTINKALDMSDMLPLAPIAVSLANGMLSLI